jgi:hypothetical protein
MTIKSRVTRALIGVGIAGAVFGAAAPAFAHTASTTGSKVTSSGSTIHVYDTKGDSHSAYGNWHGAGSTSGRVENSGGVGSVTTKNVGHTINEVQACVDIQAAPDTCSKWY